MAESKSRKVRCDKFPLTLHRTGRFCKKIKGKLYYFGTDKQKALQRYLEQAAYLHAGKARAPRPSRDRSSIKILRSQYLDHQESRTEIGEMESRHVSDQISLLRGIMRFVGPNRPVSDIFTVELQNYRKRHIFLPDCNSGVDPTEPLLEVYQRSEWHYNQAGKLICVPKPTLFSIETRKTRR